MRLLVTGGAGFNVFGPREDPFGATLGFAPQWDVKRGLAALVRSLVDGYVA